MSNLLRETRKKKKYSVVRIVEELAKYGIEMAESTYYKKETSTVPVTIEEAKAISSILKCSPLIFFK